jgi:hypothetical protein
MTVVQLQPKKLSQSPIKTIIIIWSCRIVRTLSPDLLEENLPVDVHDARDCTAKNCSEFIS